MNKHLIKIINDSKDILKQAFAWYKESSKTKKVAVWVAIVLIILGITSLLRSDSKEELSTESKRTVKLALVSDLSNNESALPLLGTVTSVSEATIRAESSGKLTRVYKKLGDSVVAGQVIAEFENSAERAALLQAEGVYDAAKVGRDITKINSSNTSTSLLDAKTNALNVISGAYTTMDDLIRTKTDSIFSDPRYTSIRLIMSVPDSRLSYSLEEKRKKIESMLIAREARNKTLTTESDLSAELSSIQVEAQEIKAYLDDLATAYSKALPDVNFSQSMVDSGKGTVAIARSTISGTITSLNSTRTALNSSIAASQIATKTSGETNTDVTSADAQVKQAQGAYNAALSRLEKTIIRSPITGTLNSLSIETGDFLSAFTEVAVVSNNGALEVVTYVTEEEAKRIAIGNTVIIDATVPGVVTRVASAIDPRTKKIEVRVGIKDKAASLINGESVRIEITRSQAVQKNVSGLIKIPLSALKLTPRGAYVFTVSTTSSLVALPVVEGAILGEEIQILSGLTGDESIVIDARGLKPGASVLVDSE